MDYDIVYSAWRHAAVLYGARLTNLPEYKGRSPPFGWDTVYD